MWIWKFQLGKHATFWIYTSKGAKNQCLLDEKAGFKVLIAASVNIAVFWVAALITEALSTSKPLVTFCQTTTHYNPEDIFLSRWTDIPLKCQSAFCSDCFLLSTASSFIFLKYLSLTLLGQHPHLIVLYAFLYCFLSGDRFSFSWYFQPFYMFILLSSAFFYFNPFFLCFLICKLHHLYYVLHETTQLQQYLCYSCYCCYRDGLRL